MRGLIVLTLLAVASFGSAALADDGGVQVTHAWARATAPSQRVGGVFLSLTDNGQPDKLLRATSPIADSLELHETVMDNGVMHMQALPNLPLDAGAHIDLKPGSYHLMAMGLKRQLKVGESFPVTLMFQHSPPVTVTVTIGTAGASGPMMDHMDMDHGSMQMPGMGGMSKP